MTKGIVYVVTGEFYTREAELSAESMKKVMPGINITIFSTDTVFRKDLFDTIINIPKNFDDIVVKIDKIKYIYQSPYDYTVFIDSDTIVIRDFSQVFQLLDNFDMAIAHAPIRQNAVNPDSSIPESFPEMNTGVMVFKKNSAVENLFKSWQKFYNDDLTDSKQKNKIDQPLDQPSFRKALYKSYIRFTVLTPEYNCRFIGPGYACGSVYILHGRYKDMNYIADRINSTDKRRIYYLKSRKKMLFRFKMYLKNLFNDIIILWY